MSCTKPYESASTDVKSLKSVVPFQLAEETSSALGKLRDALGGDVTGYVASRLHMSLDEISIALAAEQVDGVALAMYNIEKRSEAVIIGDQTGIGKGRQAAAMIRYGMLSGYLPIFFTDRYTLFSDMYRDCKALGIKEAKPLVVNKGVSVVDFDKVVDEEIDVPLGSDVILDSDGEECFDDDNLMSLYQKKYEVVYKAPAKKVMDKYYADGDIPADVYDYLMITYSQLKDIKRSTERFDFLQSLCSKHKVLFVFDEAHRSSSVSDGNVSVITKSINHILEENPTSQCIFLSATFAKRPESFITFMKRTSLKSLATESTLSEALGKGGTPMQEYVSSILASEGQMVRREHSNDSLPLPTYNYLESAFFIHSQLFDKVMYFFREMVKLSGMISRILTRLKAEDIDVEFRQYRTIQQLFYINKVLLLALKAKDVAEIAVRDVKEGKSVVIGMSDTLECILHDAVPNEIGKIKGDFSTLLFRLLEKTVHDSGVDMTDSSYFWNVVLSYPETSGFEIMVREVEESYLEVKRAIKDEIFHLPMSPIDVMCQIISREEFVAPNGETMQIRFEECTGRTHQLEYLSPDGDDDYMNARIVSRKRRHSNHIFNDFQNNKIDVILINACGAIGASAHAIATSEVPDSQVRQRKMLIVQNDLDVNIDLQKRGRINRTGQRVDLPPLYEYVITSIPSEKRLNMMLRAKLRSLSANTTASQDQDKEQADFLDISNKYGDVVAKGFISSHPDLAFTLGLSSVVSVSMLMARTAMLSVSAQQDIIDELFTSYVALEEELRRINQWDLEREFRDFEAELVSEEVFTIPFDNSKLGGGSYLGTYKCKHKTFPFKSKDLMAAIMQSKANFKKNFRSVTGVFAEAEKYYNLEKEEVLDKVEQRTSLLNENLIRVLEKHIPDANLLQELMSKVIESNCNNINGILNKKKCSNVDFVMRKLMSYREDYYKNMYKKESELVKIEEQKKRLFNVLNKFRIGDGFSNFASVLQSDECPDKVYGVLKDIKFGNKPENRFVPSKVEFVFALTSVVKEIRINIVHNSKNSNYDKFGSIFASLWKFDAEMWDKEIARSNNRIIERKIITGNILGAFAHSAISKITPRFIKFTKKQGDKFVNENGLLLPMKTDSISKELSSVTLPINDGFKFANNANYNYYICGMGVSFFLLVSKDRSDDLLFEIKVDEHDTAKFEKNKDFDAVRSIFYTVEIMPGFNDKGVYKGSKKSLVYYTIGKKRFGESALMKVLEHFSMMDACILIPREMLTSGEIERLSVHTHEDNEAWEILDWKGKDAIAVPPSRKKTLLHISSPEVANLKGVEVEKLSADVVLAQETLSFHGQIFDEFKKVKLRELYFKWRQYLVESVVYETYNVQKVINKLQDIVMKGKVGSTIDLSERFPYLQAKARSQHLSLIGLAIDRYEKEFLFFSPSKKEAKAFLDSTPYSPRLEGMRKALQDYIDGKTEIIG